MHPETVKVRTFTAWALKLFAESTKLFPSNKRSPKMKMTGCFTYCPNSHHPKNITAFGFYDDQEK